MPIIAIQGNTGVKYSSIDFECSDIITVKKKWIDEGQKFYCPHCNKPFIYVKGTLKITHFRHYPGSECNFDTEPETDEHIEMKRHLYILIKKYNDNISLIDLEHVIKDKIADIYIELSNGIKIAVECQNSRVQLNDIIEKTKYYNKLGIYVLWIFNSNFVNIPSFQNVSKLKKSATLKWIQFIYNGYIFVFDDILKNIFCLHIHQTIIKNKDITEQSIRNKKKKSVDTSGCSSKRIEYSHELKIIPYIKQQNKVVLFSVDKWW